MSSHTTQRLDVSTLHRIRKYGKMGETFDQALNKVLNKAEEGVQDEL